MGVLAGEPEGELVKPGAADDHRPGLLQSLHRSCAPDCVMAVEGRSAGRHSALVIDQILEGDWDPGQGRGVPPAFDGDIDLAGPGQGPLVIEVGECVERGLGGVRCIERFLHSVNSRDTKHVGDASEATVDLTR